MNNFWEGYHYRNFLNEWRKSIYNNTERLKEKEKERLKTVGFSDRDIEFMEYLNYAFSASDRGIGTAHEYGGYKNNGAGRMLTKKVFRGHMSVEELYNIINKFK